MRKYITDDEDSIRPIHRPLWHAAEEKLYEAKAAIDKMAVAKDRIQYEAGWTQFIDSLEEFWVRFYAEGNDLFTNFQPWAGKVESERKSEQLLQYLYQARHQSQHGMVAVQWGPSYHTFGKGFSGIEYGTVVYSDGTYDAALVPMGPQSSNSFVQRMHGDPQLPIIENKRYKQAYHPPRVFQGKTLNGPSPVTVARLAHSFYAEVLTKAKAKFGQ
mgnify:CR=1 FL=1